MKIVHTGGFQEQNNYEKVEGKLKLSKLNENGNKVDVSLVKSYLNWRKWNLFLSETSYNLFQVSEAHINGLSAESSVPMVYFLFIWLRSLPKEYWNRIFKLLQSYVYLQGFLLNLNECYFEILLRHRILSDFIPLKIIPLIFNKVQSPIFLKYILKKLGKIYMSQFHSLIDYNIQVFFDQTT